MTCKKFRHMSIESARKNADKLYEIHGDLQPYFCVPCNSWHLLKAQKRKQKHNMRKRKKDLG